MDPNKQKEFNKLFLYAFAASIVLMAAGWFLVKWSDSFWPVVFLIAIALLSPTLPFKRRFNPINFCIALIILIHLIIAPFIYVWALKRDSGSFAVDQEIIKNEQVAYLKDAADIHNQENTDSLLKVIGAVLASGSPQLNFGTDYLNDNLIKIDTFSFSYEYTDLDMGWLKVYGKSGKNIYRLGGQKGGLDGEDMFLRPRKDYPFKIYLLDYQRFLIATDNQFQRAKNNVAHKQIWTYSHVLPYVLDVYDTANFKPISPMAQVIHAVHVVTVFILLLGFLTSLIYTMLSKKISRQQESG